MNPGTNAILGILDHVEQFLAECGCPLTEEQAAAFALARQDRGAA